MAIEYFASINLNKNELQNAVIVNLGTAPGSPSAGQIYFDNTSGDDALYYYNGSAWVRVAGQITHQAVDTISTGDFIAFSDESEDVGDEGLNLNNKITIDNFITTSPKLLTEDAIADGDYIVFLDGGSTGDAKKEAVHDLATLFAGTGLTASSSVISVDASQAITALTGGDLTIYENANNADVSLKMGTSATESLTIQVLNGGSNKTAESVLFSTATASSTGDHGQMLFAVDGTTIFTIDDGGVSVAASMNFEVAGTAILSDSSGTMTLSNIDALDSTTEATIEGAIDTLSNLVTVGALNSGSITSGFGSIDTGSSTITTTGAISGGTGSTFSSSSASEPVVHITNTHAGATAGELRFNKDSASGADNDVMGTISFYGTDASNNTHQQLAKMDAIITDSAHGSEAASLRFYVAENDGTNTLGLTIAGQADDDGEVDVTIGAGAGSTTTIVGNLEVSGTTTTVNQTIIESTVDVLVFEGANDDGHETTLKVVEPTADCTFALPTLTAGDYFIPAIAGAATDASAAVTAAEFALLDGGSTVGTTAVANGDGIFTNDGGTMRHTTVQTFQTYFDANSVGGGNIVTTGDLDSGSITSGFGAIDNGTSGIRTDNFTAETAVLPDAVGGATLGSASAEWGDIFIADDKAIKFGNGQDWTMEYNEDGDDDLLMTGDTFKMVADTVTFTSGNANDPLFIIQNTANDATGAILRLKKDKGAAGAANDYNGKIQFYGDDANQDNIQFAAIESQVKVHTNGQEGGKLSLLVAENDGTSTAGLIIEDGSADGELDVTIAAGTQSVTTIAGTLTMGSAQALDNDGLLVVANQAAVTGVGELVSGSIGAAFGNIDNGTSNITTGGLLKIDVDADADDLSGDSAAGRLTIGAGEDLNLYHGGTNSYIVNDTGDLIIDTAGDIKLDAAGNDFKFLASGTEILNITNSSSDVVIKLVATNKDIIFQADDGTEVARAAAAGTFNVVQDAHKVVALIEVGSITHDKIVTIPHNLGTADIMVQMYDVVTEANVHAAIARTSDDFSTASTSSVSIDFGSTTPPNNIRVLITSFANAQASGTVAYT